MSRKLGYKIMPVIDGELMSGAGNQLGAFDLKRGAVIEMPGNGIYMSTSRDFVLESYSGLADEEVLITFSFDPKEITSGNMTDREPEITVPKATIRSFEYLMDGELVKIPRSDYPSNGPGF
jgi:hypothetical protein